MTRSVPFRRAWLLGVLVQAACAPNWDDPDWEAKVAACDAYVASMLSTRDMVELERSKFVIRRLNCGIEHRLPTAPAAGRGLTQVPLARNAQRAAGRPIPVPVGVTFQSGAAPAGNTIGR